MKHFLVELLVALVLWAFESNLLVAEEHKVLDEDLGGLLKSVLRVNGREGIPTRARTALSSALPSSPLRTFASAFIKSASA